MSSSTLIPAPPVDLSRSEMENVLELRKLTPIDPNLYTNARPLWHPPGARGIYGGAVIAQCLAVAQQTVPDRSFVVHSMHCYFILAGNSALPIIYHVERVRDGKSFCTRTVQARQDAKAIFTTTLSFSKPAPSVTSSGKPVRNVEHAVEMPGELVTRHPDATADGRDGIDGGFNSPGTGRTNAQDQSSRHAFWTSPLSSSSESILPIPPPPSSSSPPPPSTGLRPFETRLAGLVVRPSNSSTKVDSSSHNDPSDRTSVTITSVDKAAPQDKLIRLWIKARGRISSSGGQDAHLAALAYMSDSYFLFTVARVHDLFRFSTPKRRRHQKSIDEDRIEREMATADKKADTPTRPSDDGGNRRPRSIGMMVSLDHTIYFHNPTGFRADEWMFCEMVTPWAGAGRGLVIQHMFTASGQLVATCVQEGVVRLNDEDAKL